MNVSEWMSGRMITYMNEWMNEWLWYVMISKWVTAWINQIKNKCESMNEWVNEWMNMSLNKWMNGRMIELNEWILNERNMRIDTWLRLLEYVSQWMLTEKWDIENNFIHQHIYPEILLILQIFPVNVGEVPESRDIFSKQNETKQFKVMFDKTLKLI